MFLFVDILLQPVDFICYVHAYDDVYVSNDAFASYATRNNKQDISDCCLMKNFCSSNKVFMIYWFDNQDDSMRTEVRQMSWKIFYSIKSDQDKNSFRSKNDEHG